MESNISTNKEIKYYDDLGNQKWRRTWESNITTNKWMKYYDE